MQGTQVGALGQDTQSYSSRCSFGVEITLQAGGPQATCIHIYRAEGQDHIDFLILILRRLQIQKEVWYKRQIGQNRQSKYPCTGVLEQRPKGIFPPVDVVRAYYLEGYTLYYHLCSPWRFFVFILRQQSVWTLIGTASDVKQEQIIIFKYTVFTVRQFSSS